MPAQVLAFERFGPPAEVLSLRDEPLPSLSPDAVRVRIECSPINPADLNYVEGTYGIKPPLPAVGGVEGAGTVVEAGAAVTALKVGDLVAAPRGTGHWRTDFVAPAAALRKFPAGLTPEQAAVFRINPATAWCLLHEFVSLKPGEWVAQNAATSAVGRMVIAIARNLGLRTVNLVRRPDDVPRLKAEGADLVVVAEGADPKEIVRETGGPVRLGLNAVGGESAGLVGKLLGPEGVHATYGAMARQPVKVSNAALIFQDVSYRGFWISRWREQAERTDAGRGRIAAMEEALAGLFRQGVLGEKTGAGIEAAYPLGQFAEALAHAARPGRSGKVAFRPRGSS